tara:strand:+ start:39682 stop:39849 length:168 start_codon:yes stop_codon:yes gene_type:complete
MCIPVGYFLRISLISEFIPESPGQLFSILRGSGISVHGPARQLDGELTPVFLAPG